MARKIGDLTEDEFLKLGKKLVNDLGTKKIKESVKTGVQEAFFQIGIDIQGRKNILLWRERMQTIENIHYIGAKAKSKIMIFGLLMAFSAIVSLIWIGFKSKINM